jgi:hypothetical protein
MVSSLQASQPKCCMHTLWELIISLINVLSDYKSQSWPHTGCNCFPSRSNKHVTLCYCVSFTIKLADRSYSQLHWHPVHGWLAWTCHWTEHVPRSLAVYICWNIPPISRHFSYALQSTPAASSAAKRLVRSHLKKQEAAGGGGGVAASWRT